MRPRAGSLERRLVLRLTLILAASFLLFAIVYAAIIQGDAHFDAAEEVGELAIDMGKAIQDIPGGARGFDPMLAAAQADWPPGSAFAAVELGSGTPVQGSSPGLLAVLRGRPATQLSSFDMVETANGVRILAVERVTAGGRLYFIALMRPMSLTGLTLSGLVQEFSSEILPSFLPALVLAVLVTWVTIRVNLRPLRRASAEAGAVSVDHPGQRISTNSMASEISPLIDAVNRALSRLESGIAAQKRFSANAAHELRTPLAVLRARVDSMAPAPMRAALTRDITRLTRAVSQMLLTAQVQAHQMGPSTAVDLTTLVRDVVADLAPLAHETGKDIVLDAVGRPFVHGSAPALESAVRNLVENALRFSPPGESVMVRVRPGARVEVKDCGPGVPLTERVSVFEPFWRAAGQRGSGAGLGLAIVKEVAEQHGGSAYMSNTNSPGAHFVLDIPEIKAM